MDAAQLSGAFTTFLQEMYEIGWIQTHFWVAASSLEELRVRMGSTSRAGYTRSHKKCAPQSWGGIVIEAATGALLGVDLELYAARSSFTRNRDVLVKRMQLPAEISGRDLLAEWSMREACFKALSQYGEREHPELNWRKMRRINDRAAEFRVGDERISSLSIRQHWSGDWLLSFARVV